MFLRALTPYFTWLGMMLTSKPADLQNQINILNRPTTLAPVNITSRPITRSTTPTPTTLINPPLLDYFLCVGRPLRRYPHPRDCSKFYDCEGGRDIVPPQECPKNLYFSSSVLLCTLPNDSGCSPTTSTTQANNESTTQVGGVTSNPIETPRPGSWLAELRRNYNAVQEPRLVMYYDRDIVNPNALQWPISFTRALWNSEIDMYGNFGEDNRLYILFRGTPQAEEINFSSYLDSSRGNINGIEVGSSNWSVDTGSNMDLIARNIAHLITQSAKGIRYPGLEPKWPDIFVYDYYSRTNQTSNRDRYEEKMREESEDEIASVPLFSQWYLPIYRMYGSGSVLNRFLINRERYFPRTEGDNTTFARTMNRGEFVHFWSAGAGATLQSLATSVFGWSGTLNDQFQRARQEFSELQY